MGKPVKAPELLIIAVSFRLLVPITMLLASLIIVVYLFKGVLNSKSHQVWLLFWDTGSQNSRGWEAALHINWPRHHSSAVGSCLAIRNSFWCR